MKNLLILFSCLFLIASTCDEDNCKDGDLAPSVTANIKGHMEVLVGDGIPVVDARVEVKFQKNWCDGAVGYLVEYEGLTDWRGEYSRTQEYTFDNEKDFILIQLILPEQDHAAGFHISYQEEIIKVYSNFVTGGAIFSHTFQVDY